MRLWPGGLFWRSFVLLVVLIALSLGVWYQTFRVLERTPRAFQIAQQIVSIVNVTRAGLVYAAPDRRPLLIRELLDNEGIRIYPLEDDDRVEPFPDNPLTRLMTERIQEQLGRDTRIVAAVNDRPGIWVSFSIEDDHYWAFMERERLERVYGQQWIGWASTALLLSMLGAVLIVRFVNRPLTRLAGLAESLARGARPDPLPERGPEEIRTVNASFNRMMQELARLEDDRALMLAGISHDLRTPLARLRLELEMSPLPDDTKAAVEGDVAQMDRIIGRFMEYGRASSTTSVGAGRPVDLAAIVEQACEQYRRPESGVHLMLDVQARPRVQGDATDLQRVVANLIENACRYGCREGETARIEVRLQARGGQAIVTVRDHGPGIQSPERLLRPFVRGEQARSDAEGAGLGLAIVDRIVRNHGGHFSLDNAPEGGAQAVMRLPLAEKAAPRARDQ